MFAVFRREDVDHIASHAEVSALKIHIVALVLHLGKAFDRVLSRHLFVLAQVQNHAVVIHRIADTVNGRHRRHNHHILPFQQRFGGRQAHLLNLIVDAGICLDIHIARWYVGFWLVIVVVGNEIFHRVFREKIAQLGIQLRCQRLVRRHDDRGPPLLRDDIGHSESLAGAGYAQQRLKRQPLVDSFNQLSDGRRLVARRFEWLVQAVRAVGEGYDIHDVWRIVSYRGMFYFHPGDLSGNEA